MALELIFDGKEKYQNHQGYTHQQTGQHAAHEQLGHADAGRRAVNDQGDAGRENGSDDRGSRRHRAGKVVVVAVFGHSLHLDGAKAACIRRGAAGHARENDAGHDVGVSQTSGNPAHQLLGEAEDFVRDLACVHQVAGQDEQRDGDEQIGIDAGDHFLADDHHGVV